MQDQSRRIIELKLLTASKDVGLRRLRNFAAPVGGRAEIVGSIDDLLQKLTINDQPRTATVVVNDGSIDVSPAKLQLLREKARVFHLIRHGELSQASDARPFDGEFYAEATLNEFFDSAMIRRSLPQLAESPVRFEAASLLGWGHTTMTWTAKSGLDLTDAAQTFNRSIGLTGPGRRMVEILSHHAVTRLPMLRMALETVTFGSDGMLVAMALRCGAPSNGKLDLGQIASELRNYQLPMALVNNRGTSGVDLIGLVYPANVAVVKTAGAVVMINQTRSAEAATVSTNLQQAV